MNLSRDAVETSYRFCRRISGRAGSSFHAGFLLLAGERRRAMEALYAFLRHTDDLADDLQTDRLRRDALTAWRATLERAMLGDFDPPTARSPAGAAILPAVADAVRRFRVPHQHLYAVIDGVEMDLARQRYETFDELQVYCQRVASAVGLACICIWGFRGPEAFPLATKCGIALQLTNILRDLGEDVALDRVYLPQADLRQCDYSVDDLRAGVDDGRFRRLMALEVARAEQFYTEGAELIDWLEPPGRRIFGLMMATYRALLRKIARLPAAVFHRHVRLSGAKKLQLVARWSLLPPRKAALG
jgi:15-cis-phytoene synthase